MLQSEGKNNNFRLLTADNDGALMVLHFNYSIDRLPFVKSANFDLLGGRSIGAG